MQTAIFFGLLRLWTVSNHSVLPILYPSQSPSPRNF